MYPYQNPVNDFYLNNARPPQQQWLPFPPQNPPQPQIVSRFVTNIEEAKAALIDPLSINIFMDSANGKIYIKKMGDKGLSEFYSYTAEEAQKDPITQINDRLSKIESFLGGLNDKSISGNASVQQSQSISQSAITKQNESNDATESTGISNVATNDKWQKRH